MRIFFGGTLPEETKTEIINLQKEINSLVPDARFEGRDKIHITLQFIGDFPYEKTKELYARSIDELKAKVLEPSMVDIYGMDYFPNERVRRGIWLDCRDGGFLAAAAESLRTISKDFDIVPESRPFRAHITIVRFKASERENARPLDLRKVWDESKLSVERFYPKSIALFQSKLLPSGSEYRVLHEFLLQH